MTPTHIVTGVARRATAGDVAQIVALVGEFAAEDVMLPRTAEQVLAALDDYRVVRDARGRVLACAALREYSPSLAEVVSVAVCRDAQGQGLGRVAVDAVERLATLRGFASVFAHTLSLPFFHALGYAAVDRARFPEKRARPHTTCVWRSLAGQPATSWSVAA